MKKILSAIILGGFAILTPAVSAAADQYFVVTGVPAGQVLKIYGTSNGPSDQNQKAVKLFDEQTTELGSFYDSQFVGYWVSVPQSSIRGLRSWCALIWGDYEVKQPSGAWSIGRCTGSMNKLEKVKDIYVLELEVRVKN